MNDLIETACHNACHAMHAEIQRAVREERMPETCLILAAALDAMVAEGITSDDLPACVDHLRRSASPGRGA